jgi:integrase/recombinase XerD
MTAMAPTIEAFFTERLLNQRQASPRTIAAYRDTLRLLLSFAHENTGKMPTQLDLADVDRPVSLVSSRIQLSPVRGDRE